ncbi:MAG: hypothetical protein AB2693_16225 [Candidatus Thiodiazotropha sp.]
MKKSVLLPYDRYQRLLTGTVTEETSMTTSEQKHASKQGVEDSTDVNKKATDCQAVTPRAAPEALIEHFPKPMHNRLRSLLVYIQPHVSWNDKGEVTIEEKRIPGSNIVDLIKVHLKDYKNFQPVGKEAFGKLLLDLNVPVSLLAPSARQHQSGSGNIPPPPGIPLKRHYPEDSLQPPEKSKKWLRL